MAIAAPSTSNDIEITQTTSNLQTIACGLPVNRADGDIFYVFSHWRNDSADLAITWGGTHTPVLAAQLTTGRKCWLIHYVTGDPSTVTISHVGTASRCRHIVGRITGADTTSPLDVSGTVDTGTPSVTAPSLTPGVDDAALFQIICATRGDAGPYTSDGAMTNLAQGTPLSATISVYSGIDVQLLSGGSGVATGTRTATGTGPTASLTTWYSAMFTVKPAGGGGGGYTPHDLTLLGVGA